jgi:hypothetical protein
LGQDLNAEAQAVIVGADGKIVLLTPVGRKFQLIGQPSCVPAGPIGYMGLHRTMIGPDA